MVINGDLMGLYDDWWRMFRGWKPTWGFRAIVTIVVKMLVKIGSNGEKLVDSNGFLGGNLPSGNFT